MSPGVGHDSAQSAKPRITIAARNTKPRITIAVRNTHTYVHTTHRSTNNSNSNILASPQDAIEACAKIIEDDMLHGEAAVAVGSADVAVWSADVTQLIKSVSSEEIAAATVDSDVAVGEGSNSRFGSEGMEIGGTEESAVAVVGIDGEGQFLGLLNNRTCLLVEDQIADAKRQSY